MKVIRAKNVHEALPIALMALSQEGIQRNSRNGPVLLFEEPVTTVYTHPRERVMFHPIRDANPFFHFFECLWMIAGRNDVEFPAQFANNIRNYSDDGKTFHGAYGYRWRKFFGLDQINVIVDLLKNDPDNRRCVLEMWGSASDLGQQGKDFPCNTHIYFSRDADGCLDMTVCNRSNDIVWGCYGANAVHFSFLQEFIASCIGCPVGTYYQVSNNLHAYLDTYKKVEPLIELPIVDVYVERDITPFPIMQTPKDVWERDLSMFISEGLAVGFNDPFFRRVASPLWAAHQVYKNKNDKERYKKAIALLYECGAEDWKLACIEWVERRKEKFNERSV